MKFVDPTALALVCLLVQGSNVSATKSFAPPKNANKPGNFSTAANFDPSGAKMEVCPSGNCTTGHQFMRLTVASITETDSAGTVVTTYDKFNAHTSDWTDIISSVVSGVNVSSTTYISTIEVGTDKTKVGFNLTASIYQGNATVTYGSQTLTIPAGALKFTVDMAGWPFKATTNTLALALSMEAKAKNGTATKPAKKPKGTNAANATKIDRVDMGDSMFMDVPSIVFIDGSETAVLNSTVITTASGNVFQWVFPSFKSKLHYDPVLGSETSTTSSSGSSSGSSTGGTAAPAATTAAPTSFAPKLSISGFVAGAMAGIAYFLL